MIRYVDKVIYESDNANGLYRLVCDSVNSIGDRVANTHELRNITIRLTNMDNNIIYPRASIIYALGELIWYFSGDNHLDFINKFSSVWNQLSDDGKTCNSAYGYLLQEKFGFNQIDTIIRLLKTDSDTRRAVLNLNYANKSVITTKDEPCTVCIQFFIRNNKLHTTVYMRSNDLYTGFPYDILFFTELTKYIASKLNIKTGEYTHIVGSLHFYDENINKLFADVSMAQPAPYKINIVNLTNNIRFLEAYCWGFMNKSTRKEFHDTLIKICKIKKILEDI